MNLANGKELVLETRNNNLEKMYVHSIRFNGKSYPKAFITHDELGCGGALTFEMKNEPLVNCEFGNDDLPFSLSNVL